MFSQISPNVCVSIFGFIQCRTINFGAEMYMVAFRIIRATALGLMFFLAVTSACTTDSYDPDPYDDIPPVVTVEYNYLLPNLQHSQGTKVQAKVRQVASFSTTAQLQKATQSISATLQAQATPALLMGAPQVVIPLRR